MRKHRRAPVALIAASLIGLSASAHAGLSFNCSESLTIDTTDGFVMRCTGQLDVLGQGSTDPDSALINSQGIRLEATLGLSIDQLTLAAPSIELHAPKIKLGNALELRGDTINIQSPELTWPSAPPVLQPIGTRPDVALRLDPNRDDALTWGTVEIRTGADLTVHGTMTSTIQVVAPAVPEPSTWALMLGGLGLMAFMRRRSA